MTQTSTIASSIKDVSIDPDVVIITSPSARSIANQLSSRLAGAPVVGIRESTPPAAMYLGLGSGAVMDAAKRAGHDVGARVVLVPTVISTDAAFSDVAAFRRDGTVDYSYTGVPEAIVLDLDLLTLASWDMHVRGLGDLLSIESAARDWRAREPLNELDEARARSLVDEAIDAVTLFAHGGSEAIRLLADLLHRKVQLGIEIGSARFEEGSEHFLAYLLEGQGALGSVWHGDALFDTLRACSVLQEWDRADVWRVGGFLKRVGAAKTPSLSCSPEATSQYLRALPAFAQRHGHTNCYSLKYSVSATLATKAAAALHGGWVNL